MLKLLIMALTLSLALPVKSLCDTPKDPISADIAYYAASKRVDFEGWILPKLMRVEAYKVTYLDTKLLRAYVAVGGDSAQEWNGRSYDWDFYYRTPSIGSDTTLVVRTYRDSITRQIETAILTIPTSSYESEDTVSIASFKWSNADSLTIMMRQNGYAPFRGGTAWLQRKSVFNKDSGRVLVANCWILHDKESTAYFDAASGRFIVMSMVSVDSEGAVQVGNGNGVQVFANGTSVYIRVGDIDEIERIDLLNINGATIQKIKNSELISGAQGTYKMELNHYAIGYYLLRITTRNTVEVRGVLLGLE